MLRRFVLSAAACLAATHPLAAQSPRLDRLNDPEVTFPEPLSAVTGLRELSDGRVIVSDSREQAVRLLDWRSGTFREVGRQGDGPGEFGMPGRLFALRGDTTWMLDMPNRRMLVILPEGRLSTTTIAVRPPGIQFTFPQAVDRAGRVYFDLSGVIAPGMEQYANSGAAPLLRWDPASDRVDTIAQVGFPPAKTEPMRMGEVRVSFGGGRQPYQGRDSWAVTLDGKVGIARYQPYRVEWHGGAGAAVVGPTIPYTPVTIGRAEKEAWSDAMRRGVMMIVQDGQRRTMRPPRPNIDEQEWPEVMPPFAAGAAWATPDGELWVERSRPAADTRRRYDVFDAQGRLARTVELGDDRRIVGFGDGVVYVARQDEDDLLWLERYRR